MPRLLHMADAHLGARHQDLAEAAAQQRERQFAAFSRAVDEAIKHRVDVVLICGDLFDSNAQPRRSVERAAGELRRLADQGIRSVLIPGTHDCYDTASIYRSFDLAALAGQPEDSPLVTVLTPDVPDVVFKDLALVVYGRVFAHQASSAQPAWTFSAAAETRGALAGRHDPRLACASTTASPTTTSSSRPRRSPRSGLHYLALGHWHSFRKGRSGKTTWAYSGAPEAVAIDQDGAGQVLLVTLDERDGRRRH